MRDFYCYYNNNGWPTWLGWLFFQKARTSKVETCLPVCDCVLCVYVWCSLFGWDLFCSGMILIFKLATHSLNPPINSPSPPSCKLIRNSTEHDPNTSRVRVLHGCGWRKSGWRERRFEKDENWTGSGRRKAERESDKQTDTRSFCMSDPRPPHEGYKEGYSVEKRVFQKRTKHICFFPSCPQRQFNHANLRSCFSMAGTNTT